MLNQNFRIVGHDIVKGGNIGIQIDENAVDPKTGMVPITEDGSITVGEAFITKTITDEEHSQVDPTLLLSSEIVAGKQVSLGGFSGTVESVNGGVAECALSLNTSSGGYTVSLSGQGELDVTDKYWKIRHVDVSGKISGIPIIGSTDARLELVPA